MSRVLKNARNQIVRKYNFFIHKGVDVVKEKNKISEILSHSDGVVFFVGKEENTFNKKESYGNFVILEHENGYFTLYAHLEEIFVTVGEKVMQGDIIGVMGASGTKHSHLHFEVRNVKNKHINPTKYLDADLPKNKDRTTIRYQAYDNIEKKWLPLVSGKESYAGVFGNPIGAILLYCNKNIKYFVYQKGQWVLYETNKNENQEIHYTNISGFKIESDSEVLKYRVHFLNSSWSSWVCSNNKESIFSKGKVIDAIQIKLMEED